MSDPECNQVPLEDECTIPQVRFTLLYQYS
jgi:hypothetical protein